MNKIVLLILSLSLSLSLYSKHPNTPLKIIKRIDSLLMQNCCTKEKFISSLLKNNINYPIDAALFRVFKRERIIEIWAKNRNMIKMKKVMEINIAAMDFIPSPKFKMGDHKTPEGFYRGRIMYGSSNYFMWMKLNEKEIDEEGKVGDGSSFKICIDYPNNLDRLKSKINKVNTGGAICVHGNAVSDGCISFENRDFLPVFAFSKHHNIKRYGAIQYHIYPFKFDNIDLKKEADKYYKNTYFSKNQLYYFWLNLQEGYNYFNKHKIPIKYKIKKLIFKENDKSIHIRNIKNILKNIGLFDGESDEVFTEKLKKSVKMFQKKNNLMSDGIIGFKTLHKLGYIYSKYEFFK